MDETSSVKSQMKIPVPYRTTCPILSRFGISVANVELYHDIRRLGLHRVEVASEFPRLVLQVAMRQDQ